MSVDQSHETTSNSGAKDARRQQFTNKQRMDMYAFCVLELEMHSNKVSIKKQQQAIQRVLNQQQQHQQEAQEDNLDQQANSNNLQQQQQQQQQPALMLPQQQQQLNELQQPQPPQLQPHSSLAQNQVATIDMNTQQQNKEQLPPQNQELHQLHQLSSSIQQQSESQQQLTPEIQPPPTLPQQQQQQQQQQPQPIEQNGEQDDSSCNLSGVEGKTLLQLRQEVAMTGKCYSDYQKTQVLTSAMLRDVQKRFAKYYPSAAIPSRTTIKHVFEKCVAHGTVENIKTPRKVTKIPQGDEIEFLLIHEPQLSLRQMAQKLNVSTGTVSRRCKALGLVPESVTIKHQQLATARRQKQIKQLERQTKSEPRNNIINTTNNNNNNGNSNNININNITTNTATPNGIHQMGGDSPKYLSK